MIDQNDTTKTSLKRCRNRYLFQDKGQWVAKRIWTVDDGGKVQKDGERKEVEERRGGQTKLGF